ncbi:MAG TPA: hypothetical protein VK603_04240 [Candidatus Saccharimonadales bacterium]|nr:hypothetical protein [Candidatus Saccharimonadales bacterium]
MEIEFEAKMMETCKKSSARKSTALALLVCATLLSGCSTFGFKQPDPITISQVIQMNKDGVPTDSIIKTMRDSDSVYRLTAAQLAELHDMGLPNPVLNYMQQTYIEAERREQSSEDWGEQMWGPFSY